MILLSFTIADSQLINMLGSAKPITFVTFTILALLPSLILTCTMNFIPSFVSATSHYSIGFSAYTAVGVALIIAAIAFRMLSFLPERIQKIRKFIGPVILLSSIYITGATVPSYINDIAKMHETRRANDIRLIEKISFLSETGAVPLITPYFPNFELPGQEGLNKFVFEEKLSSLQGQEYGLFLMIDYGWYSRFLEGEPTEYDLIDEYDNWLENKDLYTRLFAEGTLSGKTFERIYVQDTSQIWATQNLAKAYREKF
jgi:hypothetical protein